MRAPTRLRPWPPRAPLTRAAWVPGRSLAWSGRRTAVVWAATRAFCVLLVAFPHLLGAQQDVLGDVRLYESWGHGLTHGAGLPTGDQRWQYPPGAAVVLAVPSAVRIVTGLPYLAGLVVLLLAVDAGMLVLLRRWRGASAGALWVVGVVLLGPVTFARFDLVPAALAGLGLLAASRGRAFLAGLALGLGGLVKVWPALLLIPVAAYLATAGPARDLGRLGRLVGGVGTAGAGVGVTLVAAGWWHGATGFLGAQSARGLQLEAVPAVPFVLARAVGVGSAPAYSYGSLQFGGSAAEAVATACTAVEGLIVVALAGLWWVRRGGGPEPMIDRSLLLIALIVVTSRVFSPQYLIWLLALAACRDPGRADDPSRADDLARADGSGRAGGAGAAGSLLLATAFVAQVVYPFRYNDVIQGRVVGSLLLAVRDGFAVTACWYAWRTLASPGPPSAPAVPRPARPPTGRAPRRRTPPATGDVRAGAR